MMGSRRPPPRPMGVPHGIPPPQMQQFVAPKLWSMQIPKLPTEEPFIPDLQAPNGTELEEKLSVEMIEHGYRDPPMANEFGNLRHYFRQRLADVADMRSRVGNEIDVLTWCIQARTKPTAVGDVYRIPSTSGAMNDAQKKEWMRMFVSPELRVNSLETIPHFKIDALIKCLYEFDVPYLKALWLIKVIFRDTRSTQQKDDFAQGISDAIKFLTQTLYASSSSNISSNSTTSHSSSTSRTQQGRSTPSVSAASNTHSTSTVHPPSTESDNLNASSANLTASMVISFPKPPPKTSETLSPEQLNAKSHLAYVVRLLSWTHRDGFIPLDILTGGLANEFNPSISDSASCVYISVLFQFLPDIIINSPALDKFKAILQHLADKFAAGAPKKDNTTNPRLRLFSLYCSTLKVLVSYLPDFLDPQHLEFLRQCFISTYGDLNNHVAISNSTVSSPYNPVTPFSGQSSLQASGMSLHLSQSVNSQVSRTNGLHQLIPSNLHPGQLSSLHLLYQNINSNRAAIAVDAACYDHVCNLLAINNAEGFPVTATAPVPSLDFNNTSSASGALAASNISTSNTSGPNTFSSPLITALDLLDAFIRHLDLDELYTHLFEPQYSVVWNQQGRSGSANVVSSSSSLFPSHTASIPAGTTENSSMDALERNIRLICSWAISPFRSGIHRIFVVSSLLRRFLAQNPGTVDLVYDILFNFMDAEPKHEGDPLDASLHVEDDKVSFTKSSKRSSSSHEKQEHDSITQIAIMVGELIRNRAFSHDKYLRILISRGILQSSTSSSNPMTSSSSSLSSSTSNLTGERHKAYLLNIPLFGECKHDRNQRKITIQRYLPNVNESSDLLNGVHIVNKMLLRRQNTSMISKPSSNSMDLSEPPSADQPPDSDSKHSTLAPLDQLVQMPLFCRYATGQYAIRLVKWLLSSCFHPSVQPSSEVSVMSTATNFSPMDPKPIELNEESVHLSDLSLPLKSLIQTLYVILEHTSDFRSMIEISRWLLDRELQWDMGDDREDVTHCVVSLLKSYEHVLFALDIPLVPLFERLLLVSLRSKSVKYSQNQASPAATFLLKIISKRSKLRIVSNWASEKSSALDSLRRLTAMPLAPASTKPLNKSSNMHITAPDPSTQQRIKDFVQSINFDLNSASPSTIQVDSTIIPKMSISNPSAALFLLETATARWMERVKQVGNPSQSRCVSTSSSLDFSGTPTLQFVIAQSLSTLSPSMTRNVMVSLIWGENWKTHLRNNPDRSTQKGLASWVDSLCSAFAFSGENILSILTKLMKLLVDGFSSVEPSYFTFMMCLMKALSVCSFPRGERCEHKAATRWLHSLGRPIKKSSLQYFVLFCNLVAHSDHALNAVQSTREEDPSTGSLLWFLGESLLNLPASEVHSIFKSLGDSSRAFKICTRIFDGHCSDAATHQSVKLSSSNGSNAPSSQSSSHQPHQNPLDSEPLNMSAIESYIAYTLDHTNVWSVRFTWLQLQLLLDAGQEKERNLTHSGVQLSQRINEVFASTLMYKLSANQLYDGMADEYDNNSSDAIMNMIRRLDANVRLDVLNYIFRLLDPTKSLQRYYLSAALLGPKVDLHRSTDEAPTLSLPAIEKRLVEVLLTTASCCLDSQAPFPIDQILESHMSFIEVYVLPHMGDFSKWHQIRIQLYIRLSLIRWILPSENETSTTSGQSQSSSTASTQTSQGSQITSSSMQGVIPSQVGGSNTSAASMRSGATGPPGSGILDKLVVLLLRLLASPALQESVLDGKDLWTLALHTFAALKNCQKQPSTRRALTELYPTLTMPSYLRIRLEPVLQSVARKDRPLYLNNASRVLLPKGLDATRLLEEQPDAGLLGAFGARRIPSRPLTYANHLLSSSQRQASQQGAGGPVNMTLDPPSQRHVRSGPEYHSTTDYNRAPPPHPYAHGHTGR